MLGDDNENVRNVGVAKVLAHRKQVAEESANDDECPHALNSSLIRLFDLSSLNLEANAYYKLTNFDSFIDNLQQLFEAASLAAKNSHLFYLILYHFVLKSVLTPSSLYMLHFFRV